MQNSVLDIAKELQGSDLIDSSLSFRGFINFLKERKQHEKTMKVKFLDFVINHFEQRLAGNYAVPLDRIADYNDLLELIYTTIFPAIEDERDNLWALAVPIKPIIFYGTEPFYDLVRDPETCQPRVCMIDKEKQMRNKINFELVYSVILRRLYGYTFAPGNSLIRSLRSGSTGLLNYYRLNIDVRFVEVIPKGPLPDLDPSYFESPSDVHATLEYLMERLPLSGFRFEGFSAITVTDITADYVVESIKNIVLNPDHSTAEVNYDEMIRNLKALSRSNGVDFGLLPLLQVNGHPVFSAEIWRHSVVARAAERLHEPEETYISLAEEYFRDPKPIFYEDIAEPGVDEPFYLGTLRKDGVRSYALVPVYYNNHPAGVLEVSSREEGVLNKEILARLDLVMGLLAQVLRKSIDDFDNRIKAIIKENFTSIQPSVEWKFHEAAWRYERMGEWGEPNPTLETIYFKDVYPLYGAIDIRNSTIERNSALQKDMQTQFDILVRTLRQLRKEVSLELLDDLIFQCENWQKLLTGVLTTAEELDLNSFLREKISVFLAHFKATRPDTTPIIEPYLEA
ncbi:MAG TPA: GAF domain-containing protein, partial [Puia sp.]|nr:GAF domain-containing protein [Puia sp.]